MNKEVKKSIPSIVMFILVIALIVAFAKIHALESDIKLLRGDLASEVSMLRGDMSSIYNNVDDMLQKEASLLSGWDARYGEVDLENHAVAMAVTVVPKLISENMKLQSSGRDTGYSI